MEEINQLLEKLNYKLPISLSKRLDKLKSIFTEVKKQEKEYLDDKNDESKNALEEIIEFYNEECEELRDDLVVLLENRKEAEEKSKQQEFKKAQEEKIQAQRKLKQEEFKKLEAEKLQAEKLQAEKLQAEKLQAEKLQEEKLEAEKLEAEKLEVKKEKKSGIGWGGLILGGVLLIASAGAINYFGKKN
jgi:hypothetical protein